MRTIAGNILRKLGIKTEIIKVLNKVGVSGLNSGDILTDLKLLKERSSKDVLQLLERNQGKRICFTGAVPGMSFHSLMTILMSLAVKLHNSNPSILICDKYLTGCELMQFTEYKTDEEFISQKSAEKCNVCFGNSQKYLDLFNIDYHKFSDFKKEIDLKLLTIDRLKLNDIFDYYYGKYNLGEHVRTTVHRYTMKGILNDDEITLKIAQKYLLNAIRYIDVLESFNMKWKPDVVVATQGIYLLGGVSNEFCKKNNLRYAAWDFQYRKNGIIISHGDTYHHELRTESNSNWQEFELKESHKRILNEYFGERKEGKINKDDISYTKDSIFNPEEIIKKIGLKKEGKKIITIFTNVAWDGKVAVKSNIFDGPAELVLNTINYLKNKEDVILIIRIHPAEAIETKWRGLQRMDKIIEENIPDLPQNTILILPEEKISSYGIVEISDLCVVHSTKMGLEAMMLGKQVVMTGDAFFSNKGLGIQPKTREEYFKMLDNINQISPLSEEEIANVEKYAYHYFYRRTIEVPMLYRNTADTKVIHKIDDLLPGKNKDVDRLCDGLLNGTPFHFNS